MIDSVAKKGKQKAKSYSPFFYDVASRKIIFAQQESQIIYSNLNDNEFPFLNRIEIEGHFLHISFHT